MKKSFLILDFGSQFSQLIARRLREIGVYSELVPFDISVQEIRSKKPVGIILSGGPSSVHDKSSPKRSVKELSEVAPVFGICYGMQLIAHDLGGRIRKSHGGEYGFSGVEWSEPIEGISMQHNVWMSHGDVVEEVPKNFRVMAFSQNQQIASIASERIWAVQFHPEVSHTEYGTALLKHFVFNLCGAAKNWSTGDILEHLKQEILNKVPRDENVLCALSGGVDSTVVGQLLTEVLGPERVCCVFVDTGLLRKNEFSDVLALYKDIGLNVEGVKAGEYFLQRLKGVSDPEQKRKIIGHAFIDVFKETIKNFKNIKWLAQGTLYPDVIESYSLRGKSVVIKSHHNVGGLPENLDLKLVEPLRELFKDEVRLLGEQLGIPKASLWRHPFPGPGLAIRILGEVDEEALRILRDCDDLYIRALKASGLYSKIWQAFCVLLPTRTVGVQGDARTYERVLGLRAVSSKDGMTADWFELPTAFLRQISNEITNTVRGVNRVVYDVTSKPPGTIEWE